MMSQEIESTYAGVPKGDVFVCVVFALKKITVVILRAYILELTPNGRQMCLYT